MIAGRPLHRRALVRGVVLGAGGLALAGCTALERVPRPRPRDDADERLVAAALADQRRVLAEAVAVRTSLVATLGDVLDPVVEHHRAHVTILGGDPDAPPSTGTASTAPTSEPTPAPTDADPSTALTALADVERAAAESRGRDAVAAASGDLARVLAAMSAGQAQHVVVLLDAAQAQGGDR